MTLSNRTCQDDGTGTSWTVGFTINFSNGDTFRIGSLQITGGAPNMHTIYGNFGYGQQSYRVDGPSGIFEGIGDCTATWDQ